MRLSKAWAMYKSDKEYLGYSPVTLKQYELYHNKLIEGIGDKEVDDVMYLDLKEYIHDIAKNLATASLIIRIRQLKSFFRWANEEGLVSKNEAARIKQPKKPQANPKPLTLYEIESLRDACKTPLERSIFEFMYATGCRVGEIQSINKSDINWDNRTIDIVGKGKKARTVYFDLRCEIWLKKYLEMRDDNQEALFVTERRYKANDGQPRRMSLDQFRWVLKRLARSAGIEKSIYPHNLRHSFAMNMLENGAPMESIRDFLGHSHIEHTEVYAQLTKEMRKSIYDKYHR